MVEAPRVPTNDAEDAVLSYQGRMAPLAKVMAKWSNHAVDAMKRDLLALMERTGYEPEQSMAWANRPSDTGTINRLQELAGMAPDSIRKRTVKGVLSKIVSGRLTNREAVREMLKLEAYALVQSFRADVAGILVGVAEEGMYRGQYMIQKSSGVGWSIDRIADRQVRTFVGHRFTEQSAWRFLRPLAEQVYKGFDETVVCKEPVSRLEARIGDVKRTAPWRSKREARTTITEVSNDAHREAYKKAGAKKYQFMATFDERTCPVCGSLDGKRFLVDDAKPGVNYPPMHPNCRCTTVAALSQEVLAKMKPRRVYDRSTGQYHEVPQDFSYDDWYRTFGPGRTDGVEYVPKYRD